MNARESFRAAMRFKEYDQITWHEAVPDETVLRQIHLWNLLDTILMSYPGIFRMVPRYSYFDMLEGISKWEVLYA